jgi:heme exporter protein A
MLEITQAPAALAVSQLECLRGEQQLFCNLEFRLEAGQLMQIEGANGSGKTSLLRILAGLGRPESGTVYWRDRDIQEQRGAYFAEMEFLGHALGLKAELSALENLRIALALYGLQAQPDELYDALERTGLAGKENIPTRSLSAGQKQRIALARMLMGPAILWIVDEPFTALDVHGIRLVCGLLEEHLGKGGLVVLTSHQVVELDTRNVIRIHLS